MNIYEIAKEAGVSIATVSRVLNNNTKVSEKNRRKIMEIIERNSFSPTRPGKKHVDKKFVGIVCNSIQKPRTASIVDKITTDLHNLNYKTELISCHNDINEKRLAMQYFSEQNLTAIIVEGTDFLDYDSEQNNYILNAAKTTPVILLDAHMEHPNIYSLHCDNHNFFLALTEEYLKKGKNNIVLLFSSMSIYCQDIIDAFTHAHGVCNMELSPSQIHLCQNGYEEAYKYVSRLIIDNTSIDAIFTTNDMLAIGALNAAKDNEVLVPEAFDIIGYGNTLFSKLCNPPISGVNCKDEEICKMAINTVISISKNTSMPSRVVLTPELIKRGTT